MCRVELLSFFLFHLSYFCLFCLLLLPYYVVNQVEYIKQDKAVRRMNWPIKLWSSGDSQTADTLRVLTTVLLEVNLHHIILEHEISPDVTPRHVSWDGRATSHKTNFHFRAGRPLFNRLPIFWRKEFQEGVFQSNFRIFQVLSVIVRNRISNTFGSQ